MRILEEEIERKNLKNAQFLLNSEMIKAVVDIDKKLLGIDAEMHADIERAFLENGSNQDSLWGINLWINEDGENFIEFDSMINIRPRQGNRSRDVENPEIREKIKAVVKKWIK